MNGYGKKNIKIKAIANPSAGDGRSHRYFPEIRNWLEEHFRTVEFSLTNGPGDATRLAGQAVESGFHRIIAIGGDGTVNEVVNGLIESKSALGVIPTGRNNDFYRMISDDTSMESAYRTIIESDVKTIDTGFAGDRSFVNGIGVGISGVLNSHIRKSRFRSRPGSGYGTGRYIPGIFKAISDYNFPRIHIDIENVPLDDSFALIAVGLGRYSNSGVMYTPFAEHNDGLFDICLIKRNGMVPLLHSLYKARRGRHTDRMNVMLYRCRQVQISSRTEVLSQMDGEKFILNNDGVTLKINPGSLKVLVPRRRSGR
jgi:diacylglycerol kinase (ATP)